MSLLKSKRTSSQSYSPCQPSARYSKQRDSGCGRFLSWPLLHQIANLQLGILYLLMTHIFPQPILHRIASIEDSQCMQRISREAKMQKLSLNKNLFNYYKGSILIQFQLTYFSKNPKIQKIPLFAILWLKNDIDIQYFYKMNSNIPTAIESELIDLFNSIKVDKSKEATIQKSTLLSLLIYHHVDTQYPEYFRYVSRSLQKFKKTTISQEQFLKIFMNPDIDLVMADKNQLADAFSILDPSKTGSIDVNQFLSVYRMSQNYQKLTKEKRDQAQDEIKQAFYSASQDGKITPMDFYHIVKFR